MDSLVILVGAMTGAMWKVQIKQVINDLITLQNFEGIIVVATKALIGASIAYALKMTCNYYKRKNLRK
jgi:hypothetical protein